MKKNLKIKIKSVALLIFGLLTVVFYQNCSKPMSQTTSSAPSSLSVQDITNQKAMLVLTAKCSSCHNSDIPSGGVDVLSMDSLLGSGAVVPTEPNLSPVFISISSGTCPPAPSKALAQKDIKAISDWILGMKKDTPVNLPSAGVPVPLAANYNSIYTNILKTKCLGCHNSANPSGGLSYSTYASTMNAVQSTFPLSSPLYTAVAVRNTMPRNAPGSLAADEKKAIFDWITAGAANN